MKKLLILVFAIGMGLAGCNDKSNESSTTQINTQNGIDNMKENSQNTESNALQDSKKPNIVILATGGTIAGSIDQRFKTTGYTAGVVGVNVLIEAVPEIKDIANISGEQLANIDSADMSDEIWLKLAKRVNELLADSNTDGVVITHGTDTMEESAYFLHLVVKSDKPVVLVGAMRPSSAISADGPKNLHNAVSLAANPNAKGRGVMVAMNDRIQSARFVSKTHTLNVDAFSSPNSGDMGYILDGRAFFNYTPEPRHTTKSEFDIKGLDSLPKVDITYSYANDGSSIAANAFYQSGSNGLIVAGTGAGSIHKNQKDTLKKLIKKGLVVVESSRVNDGIIIANDNDSNDGFIGSRDLNPQKARVLLILALTKTQDKKEIARIFEQY